MNLFAAPVLVGAGLVSAPAFWAAFVDGTTTPETALVRFLVSALLLWGALAVLGLLVGPPPRPAVDPADPGVATETGAAAEREAEPAG